VASPAAAPPAPGDDTLTYKVKSGDTLMKIARSHGTTVKAIKALNGLKTDQIKVGQVLKLPAKAAAPTEAVPATATPAYTPPPLTPPAGQPAPGTGSPVGGR
jgi:LysM repeat protein